MTLLCPLDDALRMDLAYRLHLLGLGGGNDEVLPGYLRAEETLRRSLRGHIPHGLGRFASLAEAVTAPDADGRDRSWFAKRAEAGELAEMRRHEARLVGEVETLARGLEVEPSSFVISTALRPLPLLAPASVLTAGRPLLAAGPEVSAELLLLGLIAQPHAARLSERFSHVDDEARRFGVLMAAGTAFLSLAPASDLVDRVLLAVVRELLPPQHRGDAVVRWIDRLAPDLDQPPGEIERTAHGLSRRRADRVHRAWTRGFFVPRGDVMGGRLSPQADANEE